MPQSAARHTHSCLSAVSWPREAGRLVSWLSWSHSICSFVRPPISSGKAVSVLLSNSLWEACAVTGMAVGQVEAWSRCLNAVCQYVIAIQTQQKNSRHAAGRCFHTQRRQTERSSPNTSSTAPFFSVSAYGTRPRPCPSQSDNTRPTLLCRKATHAPRLHSQARELCEGSDLGWQAAQLVAAEHAARAHH